MFCGGAISEPAISRAREFGKDVSTGLLLALRHAHCVATVRKLQLAITHGRVHMGHFAIKRYLLGPQGAFAFAFAACIPLACSGQGDESAATNSNNGALKRRWVNMLDGSSACHEKDGVACGWNATPYASGDTCANRHPDWAEGWTCEAGKASTGGGPGAGGGSPGTGGWVNMLDGSSACHEKNGVACGWNATPYASGDTCANRHPDWAEGWTCEAGSH
jgi:hypothetical protein